MEKSKNEKRNRIFMILLVILFVVSLYLVEYSSIGAGSIGQYNNGYGTFDMKSYSPEIVSSVLQTMQPEGFAAYRRYFLVDYFFVLTFGLLQITLIDGAYSFLRAGVRRIFWLVPVLRGICDILENALLWVTLDAYPNISVQMVKDAATATEIKLLMIRIWSVLFLIGLVISWVKKVQNSKKSVDRKILR